MTDYRKVLPFKMLPMNGAAQRSSQYCPIPATVGTFGPFIEAFRVQIDATGFKTGYFLGLATLGGMAINIVLLVVCLFLIAQYLEGTLHKGQQLGRRRLGCPNRAQLVNATKTHF